MSTSKPELTNTGEKYRFMCGEYLAVLVGILFAATFLYYANTMEYIIFHAQVSPLDIAILIMVLFVIASLAGLLFYRIYQSVALRSEGAHAATHLAGAPIIDQPVLQKPVVRGLEVLISMTVWGFFLYLFQSLFTAVFWVFGERFIYFHVFSPEAIAGTKKMLLFSFYLAVIMFFIMLLWATWNYWRYGRLERRKPRPPIEDEIVASYYSVPVSLVHTARDAKVAKIMPQEVGMNFVVEIEGPAR